MILCARPELVEGYLRALIKEIVMKRIKKSYTLAAVVIAATVIFVGMTLVNTVYRAKDDAGIMMADAVVELRDTFHRIHKTCVIIDFDDQKNSINFLNVEKFSGSEVGPMNLAHPEKWEGPYLKENPTMQHIAYQVVSTNKGYFITPGDGVKLPNKKIVGKDIILDKKADIEAMMSNSEQLEYKDRPLAARLDIGAPSHIQFFLNDDSPDA
jgi:hypothetical protein